MKAVSDVDARITSQMRAWACAQALRALGHIPKQARAVTLTLDLNPNPDSNPAPDP